MRVPRSRLLLVAAAVLTVAAAAALAAIWGGSITPGGGGITPRAATAPGAPATPGPYICGQSILDSPWNYNGASGTYTTSGTPAGLPTFGAPGTNFPSATEVIVVPAGNNTAAAQAGTYDSHNIIVYFEPGMHDIEGRMYAGYNTAYAGGYTAAAGKAIINGVDGATNGTGVGGDIFESAPTISQNKVDDTWEYLTIENYTSTTSGSNLGNNGTGYDDYDTWKYDTIGPNEYSYIGSSSAPGLNTTASPSHGGGYAINMGNYVTIEYSCFTQNAEGSVNDGGIGDVVANNEISYNGLGEYPDGAGSGPYAGCGCSGGGKQFFSLNEDLVNNYIHDNYNRGFWFDFDNAGMLISHNYIASNWSIGLEVEGSYNSDIADNTFVGNAWASNGLWPAGYAGGNCATGVSCTLGAGESNGGFPFGAIYLPNTGGNANLNSVAVNSGIAVPGCGSNCTVKSRYSGHFYVQGNVIKNNWGGVVIYTDTNRYPGNIDGDSACVQPLGAGAGIDNGQSQANSATYYLQTYLLETGADTSVSGATVTSTAGTFKLCSNYGNAGGNNGNNIHTSQIASPGMEVFDQSTNKMIGTISTVASTTSFTMTAGPPGGSYTTGDALVLSDTGGCGVADYFGSTAPGSMTGTPSAAYWDNCIWGSRNVIVSGNQFIMNASVVGPNCTGPGSGASPGATANLCGANAVIASYGAVALLQFWYPYATLTQLASAGLGNVFSNNAYTWTGGGAGSWTLDGGNQNTFVSQATWQSTYGQDSGSTFG